MKKHLFILAALLLALYGVSADKLAIAEPVGEGVAKQELATFWSMLEANVGGDYELITRGALQSMLTEIGLVESSGLVDLSSAQKAKLGELKTVKYVLVPKLGKIGSRYVVTLMVLDASTGEIDPERRVSETVDSWTELADKLKSYLRNIGLGTASRQYNRWAVFTPALRGGDAPGYLAEDLTVGVENALIESGVRIQNLKSAAPILKKNGIGPLDTLEPDMYAKVGDLLKIDYLVQIELSRYSIRTEKKYIEVTRRTGIRHLGDVSGNVRILSAQTGDVVSSSKFSIKVDFDQLGDDTSDWEAEDYGRHLIQSALPKINADILRAAQKLRNQQ